MKSCAYNTDPEWVTFLSENGLSNQLNFWRKDVRALKLQRGAHFYFKIRSTSFIAGRAAFQEFLVLSLEEAWSKYGIRNGVKSFEEFVTRSRGILNTATITADTKIGCIILDNAQWLAKENFIEIDKEFFPPQILASKYYNAQEIERVADSFGEVREPDFLYNIENVFNPDLAFSEGEIKISQHKKRERNVDLVRYVKEKKVWVCEICEIDFKKSYGVKYIEAHHKTPLSSNTETRDTKTGDIALLCPNCHKAVHKHMLLAPEAEYEVLASRLLEFRNKK